MMVQVLCESVAPCLGEEGEHHGPDHHTGITSLGVGQLPDTGARPSSLTHAAQSPSALLSAALYACWPLNHQDPKPGAQTMSLS